MNMLDFEIVQNVSYILASALFIIGIKRLGKESTAVSGNLMSACGMFLAVAVTGVTFVDPKIAFIGIALGALIGSFIALKVKMTSIPEMVALFNGFGGLATYMIAWSEFMNGNLGAVQHVLIMQIGRAHV